MRQIESAMQLVKTQLLENTNAINKVRQKKFILLKI